MSGELKANLIKALNLKEDDRITFGECVNRLLAETFILRKFKSDEDNYYYFIRKYQNEFMAFFDLMGWDLRHDELGSVFQVVNRQRYNLRMLTLRESELLLLLCLTYEEQRAASLPNFPIMTIADLRQKYTQLLSKEIDNTPLTEVLNNLRRYKLINPLEGRTFDPKNNPEQHIQLLPTLPMVLRVDGFEEVLQNLKVYQKEEVINHVN